MENEGKKLAVARDKWFTSNEGMQCLEDTAAGHYLKNRLERAFIAGWDARKNARHKKIHE